RTKRGETPVLRPITSWKTRTWPSQAGPAPIPIVGIGMERVICAARSAGTHSRTTAKHPASASAAAAGRICPAAPLAAPWTFEPTELAVGLGRQPDVPHHGDVRGEDRLDGPKDPAASLDLDRGAARLGEEPPRVGDGLGDVGLVGEKRHVSDDERATDRAGDG